MRITTHSSDYLLAADECAVDFACTALFSCLWPILVDLFVVEDCVFHATGLE